MSASEKIHKLLSVAGPLCDDCLSSSAAVRPRQTVNARCRELEERGALSRSNSTCPQCKGSKIVNFPSKQPAVGTVVPSASAIEKALVGPATQDRPWYWEGNVQDRIVDHLRLEGWKILSSANTATREAGKDIVACRGGKELWISVKGWPDKSINTQARHWFAGALFDLVLYKDQSEEVLLAIGIPDGFSTYINLSNRVNWLRRALPFDIYSVSENGSVRVISSTAV